MKITPKILSIPPYLSTTWTQVRSLYVKDSNLIVCLTDGAVIYVPGLTEQEHTQIFDAHAAFSESLLQKPPVPQERQTPFHLFQGAPNNNNMPMQLHEGENMGALRFSLDGMETINSAMQHNPAQSHLPDLPPEILGKIAAIAKIVAPNEIQNMPKPEPHCNCPHCQIARAIHGKGETVQAPPQVNVVVEEEVSDMDLSFEQWSITQAGENLFTVTNKLDTLEKYNVFLGHPVGCTCGQAGCEHILAVLKS